MGQGRGEETEKWPSGKDWRAEVLVGGAYIDKRHSPVSVWELRGRVVI